MIDKIYKCADLLLLNLYDKNERIVDFDEATKTKARRILLSNKLIERVEATEPKNVGNLTDVWRAAQRAVLSYDRITGRGIEIIEKYGENPVTRMMSEKDDEKLKCNLAFWAAIVGILLMLATLVVSVCNK